jgi:nitrite reductase (NO-forming)
MLSTLERKRRVPVDRSGDRVIALAGILLALAFLSAAIVSLALPEPVRHGLWLPLHLALAGGASTAIAGVLPFFVAAFAAAPPAALPVRASSVAGIALGAAGVAAGMIGSMAPLAVAGGISFIAGIGLVAVASVRPLTVGLGPGGGIVTRAYLAALAMVGVGALLSTLFLAGWDPVVAAWPRLRPAHAWLNLIGFVSLVIAATLVHFFPTVVGARIPAHRSGRMAVSALAIAPAVVAAGYAFALGLLVRTGAALALAGAVALVVYAGRVWAARARWTTDRSWHRFAIGGLASSIAWFTVGMALLSAPAIAGGDDPAAWELEPVVAPLVAGWVGLAILASATHLVPAVGPGDQATHARQRATLGTAAEGRLVALNIGVAGIAVAVPLGWSAVAAVSGAVLVAAFVFTAGLLARAVSMGLGVAVRRR